jgi:drug/metabolite transporter (DMT)-like permease
VDGSALVIAVPAAVLGAAGFGLASAAQQRATHEVDRERTLDPRLLVHLAGRPMWLLGLGATIGALALQLVALAFGPVAVVQPLLVTGVAFAAGFAALMDHRRPDPVVVGGALCCAAGLSAFLLLARPMAGDETSVGLDVTADTPLAIALMLVFAGCLVFAATVSHPSRVLALALATGVIYGVTAGLMKAVTAQLRLGLDAPFGRPELYVACVVGPIGFLLSQNTFQQGRMIAPALAVITSVDPVVGVMIGIGWLGEDVSSSPVLLAGECVAALLVIAGIWIITVRGARLLSREPSASDARPG